MQLYASYPGAKVERCVKELKSFAKVALAPGETKVVELKLSPRDLAYWDEFNHRFRVDAGDYDLLIGSSSADVRASVRATVGRTEFFAD